MMKHPKSDSKDNACYGRIGLDRCTCCNTETSLRSNLRSHLVTVY